jgi:hypothetical protein
MLEPDDLLLISAGLAKTGEKAQFMLNKSGLSNAPLLSGGPFQQVAMVRNNRLSLQQYSIPD